MKERPVERLIKLAEGRDRSVNYLVVEAILQYLEKEEGRCS
jgi:predicted transcriptional regulator